MAHLRIIEDPLGDDADERPTLAEVDALWAETLAKPVPVYSERSLPNLTPPRRADADR